MRFLKPRLFNFNTYKEISGRKLYVFPQEHANEPTRRRSFAEPDIKLYHKYARNILDRLKQDCINPKDCIIYLESVTQDMDPETIKKFVTEAAPKQLPDDLVTTLVLPLFRKGAVVRGAEDRELLDRLGDLQAATQQGADERDGKIREFIKNDLPIGKAGILLLGVNHDFRKLRDYFSETDMELIDSDLYQKYREGGLFPNFTREGGLG